MNLRDSLADKISYLIGLSERIYETTLFLPVLIKVITWDYSSIYYILKHWFTRMEIVHRNDSLHQNSHVYADQLKECVRLLDRLIADEYYKEAFDAHDAKWGELTWSDKSETSEGFVSLLFKRQNATTPKEQAKEREEYRICMKNEENLRAKDIGRLFGIIRKQHQYWWC